ncbi:MULTISPECIES: HemK2/MTQ2 family protein methyltransferase [Rhodococcus]|nr:release factor glutamine methyltransferase [Rhodococcus opacus]MBP2206394.1 release factor glutamine methyltransferase [Rhodococcus opacus]
MVIFRFPGVYRPQHDSRLLVDSLGDEQVDAGTRILDLCAGAGVVSVWATRSGARSVTAVDVSRRALVSTWLNAAVRGHSVRVVRGDLVSRVRHRRFDLIVANPPYVPAEHDGLPARGRARCWDAGHEGRALLDRICGDAPDLLDEGGRLILVQSTLSGTEKTRVMLGESGLHVEEARRVRVPFGPVLQARRDLLVDRGLIGPQQCTEELVVFRAVK